MKDYYPDKESYFMHWYLNNLYGWVMSKKLSINGFQWIKIHLSLMNILQKTMIDKKMWDIFLKFMPTFSEHLHE